MDVLRYVEFARSDRVFYEHPSRRVSVAVAAFHPVEADWSSWQHRADRSWSFWRPAGVTLPEQGGKIHVSATPDNAAEVLHLVSHAPSAGTRPVRVVRVDEI